VKGRGGPVRTKSQQRLEFEAGKCRICGCTDAKPCRMVPDPDSPIAGQKIVNCAWADGSRTLCTSTNSASGFAR